MKPVQFLKSYGPYNRGDIAGFLPEQAEALIAKKIAAKYEIPATPVRKGAAETMVKKSD